MQSGAKPPRAGRTGSKLIEAAADALNVQRRVPRREALKGLGALAVTGTAFAAVGCSSDGAGENPASAAGQSGAAAGTSAPAGASAGPAGATAVGSGGSGVAGASTGAAGKTSSAAGSPGTAGAAAAPTAGSAGAAQGGIGGAPSTSAGAGGASPAAGSGGSTGSMPIDMLQCIATPAMDEGPFFVDGEMERSNLIMGETDAAIAMATPLKLVLGVYRVDGMMCLPMSGVQVDIWHANAIGVYSDVASGVVQSVDTRGKKYLRGFQKTDAAGLATFDTIYPGWYMSRTIHVHFKLRMLGAGGGSMEFTSQMYFDEAINAMVLAKGPYASRTGTRTVLNEQDHIYNGQPVGSTKPPANGMAPGKLIMPAMVAMGSGYTGTLKIGLKL